MMCYDGCGVPGRVNRSSGGMKGRERVPLIYSTSILVHRLLILSQAGLDVRSDLEPS
jgi:hypothetical protein